MIACLILFLSILILGVTIGRKKYETYFNPLTFELVWSFGVFHFLSAVLSIFTRDYLPLSYDDGSYIKTLLISIYGALAFLLSYCFIPVKSISKELKSFFSPRILKTATIRRIRILLFCLGILSWGYLIVATSGGFLWITNSRLAYIEHRTGSGQYYALYLWSLNASFIFLLFELKSMGVRNFILYFKYSLVYIFLLFFSGSKGAMIAPIIFLLFFYDMHINKIKSSVIISMLFIVGSSVILVLLSNSNDIIGVLAYFSEYFNMTAEYIYWSDEIGHLFGYGLLTDFYSMLPRSIFENKPYIYGVLHIHDFITPGQAEAGNTFGILQWTLSYLDFGVLGVIIYYALKGILEKIIFEIWLLRQTIFTYISCLVFIFWSPFPFANIITSLIIISSIYFLLKMRLK